MLDAALARQDSSLLHVSCELHFQEPAGFMRTWYTDSSNGIALEVLQNVLQLTASICLTVGRVCVFG